MNTFQSFFLFFGFFGSVVLIVYFIAKYNYLIKKTAIENDQQIYPPKRRTGLLDIGIIILSFGLGLGVSSVFTIFDLYESTMELLIYATILLFGGLGLITTYYVRDCLKDE